jgi:ABC-type Fe3+ transport system substrate-binding protein
MLLNKQKWNKAVASPLAKCVLGLGMLVHASLMHASLAQAQTASDILTYSGSDRDQKLLEGARKEGQVVFYSAMIVNQALRPLADGFMKKYPGVKMTFWRGDTEEIIAKLTAEVRAGNLVGDLIEGTGIGELAIAANLVQPYQTPVSQQYPPHYRDPRNLWTATRLSYFSAAYNTKLVPANQAPKTYADLLDPKWKGKLSWRIGTSSGTPLFIMNLRLAWGEERAMAYFKKLKEQQVVNFGSGSARTLVDRVMAGEYPIALNIFAHHPLISAAKGAPVASVLMDPVASTTATMVVPKGIKHPYAAMLLTDFILSKEGQAIMAQAEYFPSHPDVPPLESLASIVPTKAGVPENFISPENLLKFNESSEQIYQDLFR